MGWVIFSSDRDSARVKQYAKKKEIRGAVLSAVHGELMAKDACRRNIVINGLPSKPGVSDTALVDELVETEFGYRALIPPSWSRC